MVKGEDKGGACKESKERVQEVNKRVKHIKENKEQHGSAEPSLINKVLLRVISILNITAFIDDFINNFCTDWIIYRLVLFIR